MHHIDKDAIDAAVVVVVIIGFTVQQGHCKTILPHVCLQIAACKRMACLYKSELNASVYIHDVKLVFFFVIADPASYFNASSTNT